MLWARTFCVAKVNFRFLHDGSVSRETVLLACDLFFFVRKRSSVGRSDVGGKSPELFFPKTSPSFLPFARKRDGVAFAKFKLNANQIRGKHCACLTVSAILSCSFHIRRIPVLPLSSVFANFGHGSRAAPPAQRGEKREREIGVRRHQDCCWGGRA